MECKVVHLVEACVGAHKLLNFIIGEGSESFSCAQLLQVECICDKLFRMCVAHIIATSKYDIRSFMLRGWSWQFTNHIYKSIFLYLYLFTPFCMYCYEIISKHILESLNFAYVCNFGSLSMCHVWNHQFRHCSTMSHTTLDSSIITHPC